MRRKPNLKWLAPLLAVSAALILVLQSVIAASGSISVEGVVCDDVEDEDDPDADPNVEWDASGSKGIDQIKFRITNNRTGEQKSETRNYDGSDEHIDGTWDPNLESRIGDSFKITLELYIDGDKVDDTTGTFNCEGEGSLPDYIPAVIILGEGAVNDEGVATCGLFDVDGWGIKIIDLDVVPDCKQYAPNLTVQCLKDGGGWTDAEIYNLRFDTENMIFDSKQHGTCGLFPASVPVSTGPASSP